MMPRFSISVFADTALLWLLQMPLALLLLVAALMTIAVLLFMRGVTANRHELDDTAPVVDPQTLYDYAPRSFSAPARKGIERATPTVVRMHEYRKRA